MSDAKVRFDSDNPGDEQRFAFTCPKTGYRCHGLIIAGRTAIRRNGQNKDGGIAQWDWLNAGNRDQPTFSPSINCGTCKWHGYIENGRAVDCSKNDEPEPPDPNLQDPKLRAV